MPQAKRIKSKPKSKKKASVKRPIPWGLLLVVLVTGVVLGKLYHGMTSDDGNFGAGLKTLFEQNTSTDDEDTQAIKNLVAKSSEKEFEFYEILPDIEQVMPEDLPESKPTQARNDLAYYVQAASFRKNADAEKLRARLALKGFVSATQSRASEERGTFYRVILGPFRDKRKAKNTKTKLQKIGVNPIITTVKTK